MIQTLPSQVGYKVLPFVQNQFQDQQDQHVNCMNIQNCNISQKIVPIIPQIATQKQQKHAQFALLSEGSHKQNYFYQDSGNSYQTQIQTVQQINQQQQKQQNQQDQKNSLALLKLNLFQTLNQVKATKIEYENETKNCFSSNWKSEDNSSNSSYCSKTTELNNMQKVTKKIQKKKNNNNKKNNDNQISTKNVPKNFVSAWANYMSNSQNEDRINIIILKNGYKLSEFRAFYQKMNNVPTIANFKTRFSHTLQNGDKKLELFAKLVRVYMFKFMREEILSYFSNHKKVQKNFEMYHFKNNMMCLAYNPDAFQAVRNPFGNGKKQKQLKQSQN